MKINTFFQACIYITIVLLLFTLSINFVSAMGFFEGTVETGLDINTTSGNQSFQDITGGYTTTDIWMVWSISSLAAIGGSILIGVVTRSTAFIAIYLFSIIFWTSYLNMVTVVELGNYVPGEFIFLGTASLALIWVGAIVGILSGSG